MPVAEFPGRFGWGYDGVDLFAPTRLYGTPDDLRRFVDAAHALGLGVILDVVYNHLGPDGNYLARSRRLLHRPLRERVGRRHQLRRRGAGPVREFFVANAGYWIDEFHLDGPAPRRHQSRSSTPAPSHILAELAIARARAAARAARIVIVAENEPQDARLVRAAERGGYGLDALWNDDFHHSAASRSPAAARPTTPTTAARRRSSSRRQVRLPLPGPALRAGRSSARHAGAGPAAARLRPLPGEPRPGRQHGPASACTTDRPPRHARALTALLLLLARHADAVPGPGVRRLAPVPLLRRPRGRAGAGWCARGAANSCAVPEPRERRWQARAARSRRPGDVRALQARLDERERNAGWRAAPRPAALRREDPVFRRAGPRGIDGAVLGAEAFVLRFFGTSRAATGCCWSTSAPTLTCADAPSRCWRRRRRPLGLLLVERGPRYGGNGHATMPPMDRTTLAGACRRSG